MDHMDQKTYRIGEAAAKLNLKSYVLRFWETEFPQIAPIRTEKGQRLYTESDLAVLSRIRFLLHERGLTIDGARRLLREEAERGGPPADPALPPETFRTDGADQDDGETADETPQTRGAPGRENAPAQACLFAPAPRGALAEDELHAIVTELASIHHFLVFEAPGDQP